MAENHWLIAGLGNPERKYLTTRHNIGWMVAAALCEKHRTDILQKKKYYFKGEIKLRDERVLVILPITYMNNSGFAVAAAAKLYQIPPERIVAIFDEYNFPVGKIHLRKSGGDGGHNGLSSVIEHLCSAEFYRLRCGIGRNFDDGELVDYVLSDFFPDEITGRDEMIRNSVEAIEYLILNNPAKAMSMVNSGKLFESADDSKGENIDS
ncbi:MAG: peptidyl-tRNA hydrolase, family [Bacteroidota bacterium]|nr:peptidyl-tRNA hydrolase, family [Bacteroidota bacterium]